MLERSSTEFLYQLAYCWGGLDSCRLCDGDHKLLLRVMGIRLCRKCGLLFANLRIVDLMIAERQQSVKVLSRWLIKTIHAFGVGARM